jgi:transposase
MREISVAEQRYLAVLAVIAQGHPVSSVAQQWGVSRQTLHAWLGRYEATGLEGLMDRSHRPGWCPQQMPPRVEAAVLELRRVHWACAPRRIVVELARREVTPLPSESGVYRAQTRAGLIEPGA